MTLDDMRIKEIEARLAAATPGPYEVYNGKWESSLSIRTVDGQEGECELCDTMLSDFLDPADRLAYMELFAHSWQDMRDLLDTIEVLKAKLGMTICEAEGGKAK